MGLIGLISYLMQGLPLGSSRGAPIEKAINAFQFFVWSPFLIPHYLSSQGSSYCNWRSARALLIIHTMAVVGIGIAANARTIIFLGAITVTLLYLVDALRSNNHLVPRNILRIGLISVLAMVFVSPLSDFATAMQIARASRGKLQGYEMIQKTWDVWNRPIVIAKFRDSGLKAAKFGAYDENYVTNPMLSRFVETKFHDNALFFAGSLNTDDAKREVRSTAKMFVWAALPGPFLRFIGVDVDKDKLRFTMGDYLAYLSRGIPLGSYLTGSVFAEGMIVFGVAFPIIYVILCILSFTAFDILSSGEGEILANISPVAQMNIWTFFIHGISGDSLSVFTTGLIRGIPQLVLIYTATFLVCKLCGLQEKSDGRRDSDNDLVSATMR